jgi:hypothetical protein
MDKTRGAQPVNHVSPYFSLLYRRTGFRELLFYLI